MAPAGLDHADLGIGKEVDGLHQEIRCRDEIGIEDEDKLALAGLEALAQRAGLEAGAVDPVDVLDIEAGGAEPLHLGLGDVAGLVRGIVKNLDLEEVPGIIELADGLEEALDDVEFIENGELDGDPGQGVEFTCRYGHILPVLEEEINDHVPVNAVEAEAKENGEVTNSPNDVSGASVHRLILKASPLSPSSVAG